MARSGGGLYKVKAGDQEASDNSYNVEANGHLGYKFNQYVAMEAGYDSMATPLITYAGPYVAAVGTLPLKDNFNLFSSIGLNKMSVTIKNLFDSGSYTSTAKNVGFRFGVGFGYNIHQWTLSLAYRYINADLGKNSDGEDLHLSNNAFMFGVDYLF